MKTYTIPEFGSETFCAEAPPAGTRVWAHTGDGLVWPATVERTTPFGTKVRFDFPITTVGETKTRSAGYLPHRQLQVPGPPANDERN